jgi:hypothetical protein
MEEEGRRFAIRCRYLDEAEAHLTQEKSELAGQARQVAADRRQLEELAERQRLAVAAERQLIEAEGRNRQEQLDRREAELDVREAALEQLQSELRQTQREVLEMRLATEEVWAQLAGALAPASLSRSISQVRSRLADHYRQTLDEIAGRAERLELVRRDLVAQFEGLESQRAELHSWAERRLADVEAQAARLVAREQELDRQQQHFEQLESRWQLERADYQTEIRRLLATIRELEIEEMRAA